MPTRLLDLQSLRGLACVLVLLFHAAEWERQLGSPDLHLLSPFQFVGYAGVDLFFVLSGFLITWAHADHLGRPAALLSYTIRRLWRIYPAYWVCWLGATLPRFLRSSATAPTASQTAVCLLLLPQPGAETFPQGSLQAGNVCIPQSWTLVYELMFYLLFACFFLLPRRWFLPLLLGWSLCVAGFAFVGQPNIGFPINLPLQPLVLEFLFGCLAAVALRRRDLIWSAAIPSPLLFGCFAAPAATEPGAPSLGSASEKRNKSGEGIAALQIKLGVLWFAVGAGVHYAGLSSGALDPRHRVLAFGLPSALLVFGLATRERTGSPVLPRWLQPLGDASYSIYLTHVLVFSIVFKLTLGMSHRLLPHLAWLGLMTGSAVAAGYLFHLVVERPLLRCWRPGPARRACFSGPQACSARARPVI